MADQQVESSCVYDGFTSWPENAEYSCDLWIKIYSIPVAVLFKALVCVGTVAGDRELESC
jgi:hypothetical protein